MDASEFQRLALRSESPVTADVIERFNNCRGMVCEVIAEISVLASQADDLKRYIFYGDLGKRVPDIDFAMASIVAPQMIASLRSVHGVLGLVSEVGEIADCFQSAWYEARPVDAVNTAEECGDIGWYTALVCASVGNDMGVAFKAVIEKLERRYLSNAFSEDAALNRNLAEERKALESRIDGEGVF